MSVNLETRILGKQGTMQKNRIRLLIGHTIFFTSEENRMTNEIASHQRETIFIR